MSLTGLIGATYSASRLTVLEFVVEHFIYHPFHHLCYQYLPYCRWQQEKHRSSQGSLDRANLAGDEAFRALGRSLECWRRGQFGFENIGGTTFDRVSTVVAVQIFIPIHLHEFLEDYDYKIYPLLSALLQIIGILQIF